MSDSGTVFFLTILLVGINLLYTYIYRNSRMSSRAFVIFLTISTAILVPIGAFILGVSIRQWQLLCVSAFSGGLLGLQGSRVITKSGKSIQRLNDEE